MNNIVEISVLFKILCGFNFKALLVNDLLIRNMNFSSQENYTNKGKEKGG